MSLESAESTDSNRYVWHVRFLTYNVQAGESPRRDSWLLIWDQKQKRAIKRKNCQRNTTKNEQYDAKDLWSDASYR